MKNIRALWFKPWPRTLNTHRITPYHVSFGGEGGGGAGKSASVKLMSRIENKGLFCQNQPLKHGQNHGDPWYGVILLDYE